MNRSVITHELTMHTKNVVSCPLQPGAVDILCGGEGSDPIGTPSGKCVPRGLDGGPSAECDGAGNFCGSASAYVSILWRPETILTWNSELIVPGGQHPVDYLNDVGCNCNGEPTGPRR